MRFLYFISFFILILNCIAFGQNPKYKSIDRSELELINDLSTTVVDTSLPFIVSPLIVFPIDTSSIDIPKMIAKYGFSNNQFGSPLKDTFLLKNNRCFDVINPDSLIKYKNAKNIISSGDSILVLTDPLIFYLDKYYRKNGICYFHKPIFSFNKAYAIVEYYIYCGSLCGDGEIVLMKKIKGKWIRIQTLMVWES